jgi:hypothetical protein
MAFFTGSVPFCNHQLGFEHFFDSDVPPSSMHKAASVEPGLLLLTAYIVATVLVARSTTRPRKGGSLSRPSNGT